MFCGRQFPAFDNNQGASEPIFLSVLYHFLRVVADLRLILYHSYSASSLEIVILYLLMYFPLGVIIYLDVPRLIFSSFNALYQAWPAFSAI